MSTEARAETPLQTAAAALTGRGFLTDEHEVVDRRGQLAAAPEALEQALRQAGHATRLQGITLEHPSLGRVGAVWNRDIFADEAAAKDAIRNWLDVNFDQS
ncbi:hypothetical protein BKE38_19565 [Pseudoroseomonas deserti]|uniref:Uncharacterized protein n=1 Tax=Teichococcus deserti TaxID=1817963 RepID=A0A1V2H0C4_9PROT|nr:hypothetical protein [Pseudoroseomonas deserti]ONG50083.1 hypothetical protein BKE38_19565 [Pseudoroseomonas deserti]